MWYAAGCGCSRIFGWRFNIRLAVQHQNCVAVGPEDYDLIPATSAINSNERSRVA
jgi:hypothetical protein